MDPLRYPCRIGGMDETSSWRVSHAPITSLRVSNGSLPAQMQARGAGGGFMPQPGGSVQQAPFPGMQQQQPYQQPGFPARQPSLGKRKTQQA